MLLCVKKKKYIHLFIICVQNISGRIYNKLVILFASWKGNGVPGGQEWEGDLKAFHCILLIYFEFTTRYIGFTSLKLREGGIKASFGIQGNNRQFSSQNLIVSLMESFKFPFYLLSLQYLTLLSAPFLKFSFFCLLDLNQSHLICSLSVPVHPKSLISWIRIKVSKLQIST